RHPPALGWPPGRLAAVVAATATHSHRSGRLRRPVARGLQWAGLGCHRPWLAGVASRSVAAGSGSAGIRAAGQARCHYLADLRAIASGPATAAIDSHHPGSGGPTVGGRDSFGAVASRPATTF